MRALTLPQARIPLAWAVIDGVRTPVEIDMEWMRVFIELLDRTGGISGDTNFSEYLPQFFDAPHTDAAAAEATRAVSELRNELASSRSELQTIRSLIEEQAAALAEARSFSDWKSRIEEIESALAGVVITSDLRNRVEQIEDRLI
jgi:hypothetical protein